MIGSFAADHVIADREAFEAAVRAAAEVAATAGWSRSASSPRTRRPAFGYIRAGRAAGGAPDGASSVREFVEKPAPSWPGPTSPPATTGGTPACSSSRADRAPRPARRNGTPTSPPPCATLAGRPVLARRSVWPTLTEDRHRPRRRRAGRGRAGRVATVPGAFGWDDIGDFASLAACSAPGRRPARAGRRRRWSLAATPAGIVVPGGGRAGGRRRPRGRRRRRHPRRPPGHHPRRAPRTSRPSSTGFESKAAPT